MAVTTTSAGSSAPEASRRPVGVNVSIRSVTTETEPARTAANRSPSNDRHSRWSHGS